MAYMYFISNERQNVVKIGVANRPTKRLKTFQTAHYEELLILKTIDFLLLKITRNISLYYSLNQTKAIIQKIFR